MRGSSRLRLSANFVAVAGMVQHAVDVVEDVPLADGVVAVVVAELLQGPVGDVLAAVAAVFVVDVEGEALAGTAKSHKVQIWDTFMTHAT